MSLTKSKVEKLQERVEEVAGDSEDEIKYVYERGQKGSRKSWCGQSCNIALWCKA